MFLKKFWSIDGEQVYNVNYDAEGAEDGENLVFTHPTLFKYFKESQCLFIDATYRSCSGLKQYSQVLVVGARAEYSNRSRYVPAAVIFMKSKKKSCYKTVFGHLKKLCGDETIKAEIIATDWEVSIYKMFQEFCDSG